MTQKKNKIFINEILSKPPKKSYPANKTDIYQIDDIWSSDILDFKVYGPENNRGYRYVLVIIGNFSQYGFTTLLKNKNAQTKRLFRKNSYNFKKKTKLDRNRQWIRICEQNL